MRFVSMKRLMVTTALTLPVAAVGVPAHAQENACDQLEQLLQQDMPEGLNQTEEELNQILQAGDPEQCAVLNVEIERAMQEQAGAAAEGQTDAAQADGEAEAELAETEAARIQLSDEVVVEGEVFVEQQPPEVDVNTGETEILVQGATPEVTVNEPAPEILVRQEPANIRVDMPAPTITIEQQPPEIIITMPEPGVDVASARPEVEVRQSEPTVTVRQTNPSIELQLSQAEDPEASQGVSVTDRATGETMAQGETREVEDAQVNLSRSEPVVTYQEGEGAEQAQVQIQRGEPTVRYESSEPQVEFNQAGEPQIEITQAGEPTVTLRQQGETDEAAADPATEEQPAEQALAEPAQEEQPAEEAQAEPAQEEQPADQAQAEPEAVDQQDSEVAALDQPQEEEGVDLPDAEIESAAPAEGEEEAMAETAAVEETDERPVIEREGFALAEAGQFDAEALTGQTVYGVNDDDIGDISDVVLSAEGEVQELIVDVGGFLGIGAKPVSIPFEQVSVMREEGGDELRVYVDATQNELEEMERYAE